jgi:hypothetical protein
MPTTVYNKLRPQDHLKTLIEEEPRKRDIIVCPQCAKENPSDKSFCVWCGATLREFLMADTLKQFHADQKAQEEFEEMRKKMAEMEKVMKVMVKMPGFEKLVEEAAEQSL